MSSNSKLIDCRLPQRTGLMCIDPDGSWLLFNPRTGKGAVSKIYTSLKAPAANSRAAAALKNPAVSGAARTSVVERKAGQLSW